MDKNRLISVIVPVYNSEKYLERCIESILAQTYPYIELIIVDDGSTDDSGNICDFFAQKDSRVVVFHEKHAGTSKARNRGIQYARGAYIGFVDSDDYIASDMYETLVRNMQEEIDIVCCGRRCVLPRGKSYNAYCCGSVCIFSNQRAIEELLLLRRISFSVCTKLFRKELFEDIRFPIGKTCEDVPVTYKLLKKSTGVLHVGCVKYYNCYREHSRSSHCNDFRWMDYVIFARDILRDVKKEYPLLLRQAEARYLLNTLIMLKEINGRDKDYVEERKRLEKMLNHMFLRAVSNRYISINCKKVLAENILSQKKDWTKI